MGDRLRPSARAGHEKCPVAQAERHPSSFFPAAVQCGRRQPGSIVRHPDRKWAMRFSTSLCMMFSVCLASCQQSTAPSGSGDSGPTAPTAVGAAGKDSSSAAADRAAAAKAAAGKAAAAKDEERNQALWTVGKKLLDDETLKLTGTIGSTLSSTAAGDSWSMYKDSLHKP